MKKIRNIFLALAVLATTSLLSYRAGEIGYQSKYGNQTDRSQLDLSLMWKVKEKLQSTYLEKQEMSDQKMVYGAISGLVASLDDPYTVFLPPTENQSANEDLAGQFGGVGIQLGFKDKNLAVMAPLAKTPAEKAGVMAGDLILKITDKANGVDKDTGNMSLNEAVKLIRGKKGTKVTLKLYREGRLDPFEVVLVREDIVVPSIELVWKEVSGNKKVAWIRLYKFSEQIYKDWPDVVKKITDERAKIGSGRYGGVVLDLRNNPGGFLQASVLVASDFIKEGVVVEQQSSDGKTEKYMVDQKRGRLQNDKLVVLVNGGSASAAEILAGALKEYGRGKLVGEKTFGKGTVQQPEDFADGSGIHITIAKWLLPNGKNIHKVGVEPDVEIKYESPIKPTPSLVKGEPTPTPVKLDELPDNQLDKAIEVLMGS